MNLTEREEFYQYIKIQEENLVKGLKDITQWYHFGQLLRRLWLTSCMRKTLRWRKTVIKKLHEKDIEMKKINGKNRELMVRMKQVAADTQSWHHRAKYNESLVIMLKPNIQQALSQGAEPMKGRIRGSNIDDTALLH